MVFLSFGDWWEGLTFATKIYWVIAIPASAIFIIQLMMTIRGNKAKELPLDTLKNTIADEKAEISFQLISFKNLIGFFTCLSWSGLACIDSGLSISSTLLISFICGILMMLTMAIVFYFMAKLMKTVEENL